MESGVLTVLNSDILPHVSTGVAACLHGTFLRFFEAPNRKCSEKIPQRTRQTGVPGWTLDSTGPIVKLGTADITEVDHENLIFMETPEASAASDAHLQSDHSRFSPRQPQTAFRVIMPIAPTCYQLDKE